MGPTVTSFFSPRLFSLRAKDGEVVPVFQPSTGSESLIFLEPHGSELADPVIEADAGLDHRVGHCSLPV